MIRPSKVEELRELVEENPLRQWRTAYGVTYAEICVLLRVTATTVQKWEVGSVMPSDTQWGKLARLMDDSDIESKWRQWSARLPAA